MRAGSYFTLGLLLAILNIGMSLRAQVFELSAGRSTLYGADGASLVIHGENSETTLGAGWANGHFGGGGSSVRHFLGGTMTTGQQQFALVFPTDIFGSGKVLSGTGVGVHLPHGESKNLSAFLGYSSAEGGSPLFQATRFGSPTGYVQWKQPVGDFCGSTSSALVSPEEGSSILQSFECSPTSHVKVAVTGGVGGGDLYGAASVNLKEKNLALKASYNLVGKHFERGTDFDSYSPETAGENASLNYRLTKSVSLSLSHRNYVTPFASYISASDHGAVVSHSSLEQASATYRHTATTFGVTLLRSKSVQQSADSIAAYKGNNTATYTNLSHTFRFFDLTETFLRSSDSDGNRTMILINRVSVPVSSHLHLTESVNVSAAGTNFSHGGSLVTRFSSFEVDYQILYVSDRPSNPFQQAMVFDSQVRLLRKLWLHASSSLGPAAKPLYTFRIGTDFSRNTAAPQVLTTGNLGASVLRGRVVDQSGVPIEGAALAIGQTHVYTDRDGVFSYREKSAHIHSFTVLPEEFLQLEHYAVVISPKDVRTTSEQDAIPLRIVMTRVPESNGDPMAKSNLNPGQAPQ